jgi:reverse gyrase
MKRELCKHCIISEMEDGTLQLDDVVVLKEDCIKCNHVMFERTTFKHVECECCLSKQRVKEAIEKALSLMEENRNYPPRLKDKEYRKRMTKIQLEGYENQRCQEVIRLFVLKKLGLEEEE